MSVIDKSAAGHMLAVAANGKVAAYQAFTGGSWILTLPLAWFMVVEGCGFVSIGLAMVLTMMMCSCGRVWFARRLVGMSARYWFFRIMIPAVIVSFVAGGIGYLVSFSMEPNLIRIILTTIIFEFAFLPLVWFFLLDGTERCYISLRVKRFAGSLIK